MVKCGYFDCIRSTEREDHFLCPAHFAMLKMGFLDRCPTCGRFKHRGWRVCRDCRKGRIRGWWEAPVPIFSLEWQHSLESSYLWAKRDRLADQFFVYIVELSDGSLYVGHTRDLRRRMSDHVLDQVRSTAGLNPLLAYCETLPNRDAARRRERELKGIVSSDPLRVRVMIGAFQDALRRSR